MKINQAKRNEGRKRSNRYKADLTALTYLHINQQPDDDTDDYNMFDNFHLRKKEK